MTCPKCKAQLPPGAVTCHKCGTRFKTKICPYCNSTILASATTCPRCGKRFAQGVSQSQASQAPAANNQKKSGFRGWYILIGVALFILGAAVGAFGMRQSIISNVKSTFDQVSDSIKDSTNSSKEPASAASDAGTASASSEQTPSETSTSSDYSFNNNVLVSEDVKIVITDWKVIPVGETGNEYGDAPVIAFWYSTTNLTGNENVTPMSAWLAMFSAVQDNNSNMVNELNVGMLPDSAFLDTQMATIKKDGTVDCAIAYTLDDTVTPVILKATKGIMGEDLGEQTFNIAE